MNKYIKLSAIAALALGMTGCTKSFDDINTDPDAYTTVPTTNQLGYCIEQMGVQWGDELSRMTDWIGYMVSSYANETFNYYPSNNEFGNKWYQTYLINTQLQDIINRCSPNVQKNTILAAELLQQYLYFDNVDCFGSCPYSEACKGVTNGEDIKPKYDDEIAIYTAIGDSLKSIADQWADGTGCDDELGDGDLLYGDKVTSNDPQANIMYWRRFCNSLRLRLAMRLSNISGQVEKSKATFKEILAGKDDKYPIIELPEENCYFWWSGSSSYRERWYNNRLTRPSDYNMSQVLVNRLKSQDDPRLSTICLPTARYTKLMKNHAAYTDSLSKKLIDQKYYNKVDFFAAYQLLKDSLAQGLITEKHYKEAEAALSPTDTIQYRGVLHGSNAQYDGDGYGSYSVCSNMYYGDPAGFSPYFRAAETWFLIEEAALKGWISFDPKEAYTMAVTCSMEDNGISGAEEAYLEGKGAYNGTLDQLYMEEWVALFKQSQEAWSLYRRTGYPKVLFDNVTYKNTNTTCAQYPGERCAWGYGASATHTDLPFRFPYPESEYNYNSENVNMAAEGIVNHCYGKRLCWALENGRK